MNSISGPYGRHIVSFIKFQMFVFPIVYPNQQYVKFMPSIHLCLLGFVRLLNFLHSSRYKIIHILILIYVFLINSDVEHSFTCLWAIWLSYFMKWLFFLHAVMTYMLFFISLFAFCPINLYNSLYMHTKNLSLGIFIWVSCSVLWIAFLLF